MDGHDTLPHLRQGTYSIVARDPDTGEVGVAVQSHWFSVGSIVSWARPGVGAVATAVIGGPAYGPGLLDLLAEGVEPSKALARLTSEDQRAAFRQVAVVDAAGRVAVHTGESCIAFAGDRTGDGYSVQANMMASPAVWPAMAEAFEASEGPLARRLLVALRAAEAAGGDARGRQSSAVVVAPAEGEPWRLSVDLRVEDHPEPLDEIERLLDMAEAYKLANRADTLAGQGRHEEASGLYRRAADLAPGSHELLFWSGLAAAQGGDMDTAVRRVREAIALQPGWTELLGRLQPGTAPGAAGVRAALRDGAVRAAPREGVWAASPRRGTGATLHNSSTSVRSYDQRRLRIRRSAWRPARRGKDAPHQQAAGRRSDERVGAGVPPSADAHRRRQRDRPRRSEPAARDPALLRARRRRRRCGRRARAHPDHAPPPGPAGLLDARRGHARAHARARRVPAAAGDPRAERVRRRAVRPQGDGGRRLRLGAQGRRARGAVRRRARCGRGAGRAARAGRAGRRPAPGPGRPPPPGARRGARTRRAAAGPGRHDAARRPHAVGAPARARE